MTKKCGRCLQDLNLEFFNTKNKKNGKEIKQSFCKKCNSENLKEHYKKNKQKYLDKNKKFKKENQKKLLEFLQDKECKDCGLKDCRVFEFDHLSDKKANIAHVLSGWCWESLLVEINKCEIVCCNCHRLRTLKRSNSYRYFE